MTHHVKPHLHIIVVTAFPLHLLYKILYVPEAVSHGHLAVLGPLPVLEDGLPEVRVPQALELYVVQLLPQLLPEQEQRAVRNWQEEEQ